MVVPVNGNFTGTLDVKNEDYVGLIRSLGLIKLYLRENINIKILNFI